MAPVNIALIKYWGKADDHAIIPINDSLSITLSPKSLCTQTSIVASNQFDKDTLFINHKSYPISERVQEVLSELRERTTGFHFGSKHFSKLDLTSYR